ncbi:MAG: histidinol dehydrogenase [Microscillaceae bacterium]|nr:histidinol dehydrogenase [Microscillaceae bacterium]MDW8461015.1 histidinol dehydrogenase [Cytophagales bacterium]
MKFIINPPRAQWAELAHRPVKDLAELEEPVRAILTDVKKNGDSAVLKYIEKFDKVKLKTLLVTEEEIREAQSFVSEDLKKAIQAAKYNIAKFHIEQKEMVKKIQTTEGVTCWRKSTPIPKVGLYIPSRSAPLFSTILMLGIPANIASCEEIVLCSTPNPDGKLHPIILYTANLLNIKKVFKVGGVQAIAAMAYGTQSIPKVDKIFGPSNQYVTVAKQLVTKEGTAIDMPASASEVLVIADETANPAFVAADLLAQAEHGTDSHAVLVTTSESFAHLVKKEIETQLEALNRKEILREALENCLLIVVNNLKEAIAFSNFYAPEHLVLAVNNDEYFAELITNAGSVFLGNYSPVAAGDYASGTNHTLPTNGFARVYSGVSLDSFFKKITFQKITQKGIRNLGKTIEIMAEAEGLMAHKNSVSLRLRE